MPYFLLFSLHTTFFISICLPLCSVLSLISYVQLCIEAEQPPEHMAHTQGRTGAHNLFPRREALSIRPHKPVLWQRAKAAPSLTLDLCIARGQNKNMLSACWLSSPWAYYFFLAALFPVPLPSALFICFFSFPACSLCFLSFLQFFLALTLIFFLPSP